MPSSKPLAVALVAMLLLAGCSALPGGGGEQTTTYDSPEHSELVFQSYNDGEPFEADLTVERDGETVFETTVDASGNGTYRQLATIDGNESYTVTVNTTVSGASGNRSEQFTVEAPLGDAAAVRVTSLGVYHHVYDLPRRSLDHPLGVYHNALPDDMAAGSDLDVQVWYRGERVATATQSAPGSKLTRVVELNRTGAYRVKARGTGDEWRTDVLVVANPQRHIKITLNTDGTVDDIEVLPAGWQ